MKHILVGGEKFCIKAPIILWNEPQGKSFYQKPNTFLYRSWDLPLCQDKLDMCVVHHGDTFSAEQTYQVLLQRGLSVNFIIDDDNLDGYATIYQCLDVKDGGYSQKGFNHRGAGIEVSYVVLVNDHPTAYSEANQKKMGTQPHEIVEDTIHGRKFRVYAPTQAQVNSVIALCKALRQALPKVDWQFQKDPNGNIIKHKLTNPTGLSAHFQLTAEKIDPAGMPLDQIDQALRESSEDIYSDL